MGEPENNIKKSEGLFLVEKMNAAAKTSVWLQAMWH